MKYFLSIYMICMVSLVFSQEATIEIQKTQFGLKEQIKVEYVVSASEIDSVSTPAFINFRKVSGPSKFGTSRWQNGVTTKEYKVSYLLKPIQTGRLVIPELHFYKDGHTYSSGSKEIEITIESVSVTSEQAYDQSDIRNFPLSPEGTVQIVFLEDFGYYKMRQVNGALDIELTPSQISMIRTIIGLE